MKNYRVRVLIADDSDIIRAGIKRLLSNAPDIEVIGEARNGAEALSLLKEFTPDVLLLDVEMPVLNGIEVTRQMKRDKLEIPILVLSAYSNRDYIQELLAIGASGYVIKEEAPERLIEAVRGIARGETGWVSPLAKATLRK